MAKLYRQVYTTQLQQQFNLAGNRIVRIKPLDNDQTPAGYLEKVKVSVKADSINAAATHPQILISASGDSTPQNLDIITAQAIQGSGTVWLSIKRRIRSANSEAARNDGEVSIHLDPSFTFVGQVVVETWGRYLQLDP